MRLDHLMGETVKLASIGFVKVRTGLNPPLETGKAFAFADRGRRDGVSHPRVGLDLPDGSRSAMCEVAHTSHENWQGIAMPAPAAAPQQRCYGEVSWREPTYGVKTCRGPNSTNGPTKSGSSLSG